MALSDGWRDDLVSPGSILSVQVPVSFTYTLMSGFQERGTSVRVKNKNALILRTSGQEIRISASLPGTLQRTHKAHT